MKPTSNQKQIVESYGQKFFLEKKHDFSHLKSKDITEFQNFNCLNMAWYEHQKALPEIFLTTFF